MKTSTIPSPSTAGPAVPHGPRESMQRLPGWMQPLFTAVTGKALPGQQPLIQWSPEGRYAVTLLTFLAATALGLLSVGLGGWAWVLLPLAWLLSVGASRTLQTGMVHHASHGMLFRSAFWNDLAGELASLLIWIQPLAQYRVEHGPHHWRTGTEEDPDLEFLARIAGIRPGLPRAEYWRRFWRTMFSPVFHARFLVARWRGNFVKASAGRIAASVGWAAILTGIAFAGFGRELVVAYLIPVTVLTQMSAWAGLLGLHQWVREGDGVRPGKEVLAGLTSGRFTGDMVPSTELRSAAWLGAWAIWWTRFVVIHVPVRVGIIPGDLPSHDWHHFHPKTRDWANAAFARRDEILTGNGNARLYTEIWGVTAAIDATFVRLAALPASAALGQPETYAADEVGFHGM